MSHEAFLRVSGGTVSAMIRYRPEAPTRQDVERLEGPAVLEFGSNGCGYCRAAAPLVEAAFERYPNVRHFRIEDGRGRTLGRSFGVNLWPTLIFLENGRERGRLVRPRDVGVIVDALAGIG